MPKAKKYTLVEPVFAKRYSIVSLAILLITSLLWSIKSAGIQSSNADQLVGPQLFQSSTSFHDAAFPGAHTFLLKWPLFWLVRVFGMNSAAFTAFTVLITLATIGFLVYIIYKIEKRPLIFGTLCLALASVLMLIPAQPYAGGILPVNMAMLATRNIEYIAYIGCLVIFARWPTFRNWRYGAGIVLLGLLIASDKLFLAISAGGALVSLVVYALAKKDRLVSITVHWLLASLLAAGVSLIALSMVKATHLAHISNASGTSPYALTHSASNIALGIIYTVSDTLTNFGANPAFDSTQVRQIPHGFIDGLFSVRGPALLVNIAVLLTGIFFVWRILLPTLKNRGTVHAKDSPIDLSLLLIWSSVSAIGVFILSNHYYAVDSRYLTILLFTVFIVAATLLRDYNPKTPVVLRAGGILSVGILFGLVGALNIYNDQSMALKETNDRNKLVSQVLEHHKVNKLVGDYWRTVPIKQTSGNAQGILPLQDCNTSRTVLTSTNNTNLNKQSFAYLLSFEKGLTDYPACTVKQVVDAYGRPNSSQLISGSLGQPKEQLLFYDRGINKPKNASSLPALPQTVVPAPLSELVHTTCDGPTIMNIVAHEDDDILFMNPDLLHDIKDGHCVRTIFLTAGDSGHDQFYWMGREQGSQAAYSVMTGGEKLWVQRIVKLGDHAYATVANPKDNSKISTIYLHLPDGGLKGEGFATSRHETLAKLDGGVLPTIHSVDNQSSYTQQELVSSLASFMHLYQPAAIRTQADHQNTSYPDHGDHLAAGRLAQKAYDQYEKEQFEGNVKIPISYYAGYPVAGLPADVGGEDLKAKEAVFGAYIKFDGGTCRSMQICVTDQAYGAYLTRQYSFGSIRN